ncbi:nucleolar protein 16 [Megalops cyprinoides]|uniref:nucleolar protein 16 n=1 Tax=Megalops cyprinoides TaxID=118141 RepID=UPI0018648BE3|nr:nucleolar protein 16 [Megalops cyprinoides]
MPKAKKSSRRKKYDYNKNKKKLKKQFKKKAAPRIECPQIRNAWNDKKSVAQNLKDMGLAFDPNLALPLRKNKVPGADAEETEAPLVRKPYVIKGLEEEANLPTKDTKSLSRDIIEYVQYMIKEHNDNYKAMARDEKNYYQDTPKQIKRKVDQYKRFHPEEYAAFIESLKAQKMDCS